MYNVYAFVPLYGVPSHFPFKSYMKIRQRVKVYYPGQFKAIQASYSTIFGKKKPTLFPPVIKHSPRLAVRVNFHYPFGDDTMAYYGTDML